MKSHRVNPAVGLVACLLASAPAAAADPPPDADDIDTYTVAQGRFTTPTDFYWVYFRTRDGRSCEIESSTAGAWPSTAIRTPRRSLVTSICSGRSSAGELGTVTCKTYDHHGFMISTAHGVLW